MEYLLDLAPLIAIMLALVGLLVWWRWRGNRKEERQHAESLAALAASLGGRVVGPDEARAWSAELLPPLQGEAEGLVNRAGTVRRPRFETALDFRRGNWSVRVGEASIRKQVATAGTTTIHQHRIDVAASIPAPMKISRRIHVDFRGRPLAPDRAGAAGPAAEVPVTVEREQRQWLQARLPEPMDREFTVFTTDPAAAARAFTPQAVEWLLGQAGANPFQSAMPLVLTFEAGLVYATAPQRIDPAQVMAKVDVILGLLERMGVAPAAPPR
ncbi:hypothetical protein [Saccharothrix stipae]